MTLPGGGPFRMIDNGFRNELEANNRSVGGLVLHVFDQADMRRARVAKRRLCDVSGMARLSHIPRIPDLDYPPQLAVGHVDDEEPKPGTLGESRSRTAAMPR